MCSVIVFVEGVIFVVWKVQCVAWKVQCGRCDVCSVIGAMCGVVGAVYVVWCDIGAGTVCVEDAVCPSIHVYSKVIIINDWGYTWNF